MGGSNSGRGGTVAGSRARDRVRRAIGVLTVTFLLGAAVAVGGGLARPGAAAPPEMPTPVASHQPETTEGPNAAPARTIAPTPAPPPTAPPNGGSSAGRPAIALTARPAADGGFLVTEVVTLPAAATEAVLRPPSIADAGTGFERLRPVAIDVEVRAGGQVLPVPNGPVRDEVTVRWAAPTADLRLRYRLGWVSVVSAHARAGRSLGAFGPLLGGMPADLPVTVVVRGPTLLSLTCPQLPLARSACSTGAAPTFATSRPLPYDRSRVVVQYDRPKPRR